MSDLQTKLDEVFAANDTPGVLREAVVRYRRQGGGSGAGGNGMEPRVARLEASVSHIERDIGELKADVREFRADIWDVRDRLARLEEKVFHLPSKGFIVASVLVALAVIAAMTAYQNQIQNFAGTVGAKTKSTP